MQKRNFKIPIFVAACILLSGAQTFPQHTFSTLNKPLKTIVIDPGHGGNDPGAKGPAGSFEKTVAISLAQIIQAQINPKYKVVLTRTGDYSLDIFERTAIANHIDADIFISIHTGGSFLYKANQINIFYFQPHGYLNKDQTGAPQPLMWQNLQKKHQAASNTLANIIKFRIDQLFTSTRAKAQGAPLILLQGAQMPAILVEIGYITNPSHEKNLQNTRFLSNIGKAITSGIHDFFNKMDLSE
jgi:N-acetylmuramoyl-L-alanine amidase